MMRPALLLLSLIVGAGSSYAENMHSQSRQQYFSSMDSNGSGGVSVDEFQARMAYSFNRIDKNLNNVIDADEALVPKMTGVTRVRHQANIAAQFRRQDRNKNGELSVYELTAPPQ